MKIFEINWNKRFPFIHISNESLYLILMQFIVIGILGFIMESGLEYIAYSEFRDRGFLCGPFIPIYGFAILIICIINIFPKRSFKSFLISFIILTFSLTIFEEAVGNLCQKLFGTILWTYSSMPCTSKSGYTNLYISLLWGSLGTLYLMFIVPLINKLAKRYNNRLRLTFIILFFTLLIIDLIVTFYLYNKNYEYKEIISPHKVSLEFSLLLVGTIIYFIFGYFYLNKVSRIFIDINEKLDFICFIISFFILTLPIFSVYEYLEKTNVKMIEFLATLGFINVAFLIYLLLAIIIYKIISLFIKNKEFLNDKKIKLYSLIIKFIISIVVILIGIIEVKNPRVINLNYGNGDNNLNIVAISDIHYKTTGSIIDINKCVDDINKQNPDVVFLLGDIVDTNYKHLDNLEFSNAMSKINAKYGIYMVPGNHEYESNKYDYYLVNRFFYNIEKNVPNFHYLVNEEVVIANKIRVIGRLDYVFNGKSNRRTSLEEIEKNSSLKESDKSLPLIVLDHQPNDYMDSYNFGAVLQLSGHTHDGQLFPFNVLLKVYNSIKYDCITYGNYQKDNFNLFVTRGYGHWGFPMRTSGRSELLQIKFSY